jgi:hypothetical protein
MLSGVRKSQGRLCWEDICFGMSESCVEAAGEAGEAGAVHTSYAYQGCLAEGAGEVFGVGRGVKSVLSVSCPARAAVLADPAVVTYVEQSVWLLRVVLSARFHPP